MAVLIFIQRGASDARQVGVDMAIPPQRPAWVVTELSKILGFDEETVKEAILPELESNAHEARLRSYLQDFLGPSPASKSFITNYISLRFPSITSSTAFLPSAPLNSAVNTTGTTRRTQPGTPRGQAATPKTQAGSVPQPRPADLDSALNAAFGPGGKVYQKNRDADDAGGWSRSHSQSASGSRTPARQAGAFVIHEAPAKPAATSFGRAGADDGDGDGDVATDGGRGKGKGKDKERIWDVPKSVAVKRLERIEERLREVQAGEGKVGSDMDAVECFCQARVHTLSPYTPQCPHCGLALCALHSAHRPCPSCHRAILNPAQLARLILRVQEEIIAQLSREDAARAEVERQRLARLAAESGGGAFPSLSGGPHAHPVAAPNGPAQGAQGARKVLSIGKHKGKPTITTTTYRPAPSPSSPAPAEPLTPPVPDDIVPPPRVVPLDPARAEKELNKVLSWRQAEDRPWGDKKRSPSAESAASSRSASGSASSVAAAGVGMWEYVEEAVIGVLEDGHEGRRKARKKGRGENGRVVPGAAA